MRKSRTRRTLAALGTTTAAMGIAFSGLMTGTAQAAIGDCPSNRFCLWQHSDYSGRGVPFTGRANAPAGFNDAASSVYNNTNTTWCIFSDANYGGSHRTIGPGGRSRDLANQGFNDVTSSARPC
ncbi:peptidase inhibitor family I36 protein [Streptomyces sp. NPDC050704]|uniref:peptidase inhibitor family I36 protein n=1 Tax=Streptomyces sp. NPDC050704 TaxID=3157219 RepID=UPI00341BA8F8